MRHEVRVPWVSSSGDTVIHVTVRILIDRIRTYQTIRSRRLVRDLARSMRDHGWLGRPVLGEPLSRGRVQAWTASHRIPAARRAGLLEIPVRFIDRQRVERLMRLRGYPTGEVLVSRLPEDWYDEDRLAFLTDAGDTHAAALMAMEIEANARDDRAKIWDDRGVVSKQR
jgi:hypothetical protein